MPPERLPPDNPFEWINRAESNLSQARVRGEKIYLEDLCFQAQQAAEKALKALLISRGAHFPHTHNLGMLFDILHEEGLQPPAELSRVVRLTDYAVGARYPGRMEAASEADYSEALSLAEACVAWARSVLGG